MRKIYLRTENNRLANNLILFQYIDVILMGLHQGHVTTLGIVHVRQAQELEDSSVILV